MTMASMNSLAYKNMKQPLFSFGVISDIQYADIPDGHSFVGIPRYYRHSLLVLQRAVSRWNENKKIKFSINFGDIVDGKCPKDKSLETVEKVIKEFGEFDHPMYHMIGNHCLYNLARGELVKLCKIPSQQELAYYDFCPTPDCRIVVLDAYDISAIGWPHDHPNRLAAMKILQAKNPNFNKNSPVGLVDLEKRFLMFNGAVGEQQLEWLDEILKDATKHGQRVIICSHIPFDCDVTSPESLLWNYDEVLQVIHRYECVKVCLSGHAHSGGYSIDSHGIHHRCLEAALECPPGTDAYGLIDVYDDRLSLVGTDRMECTEMVFNR